MITFQKMKKRLIEASNDKFCFSGDVNNSFLNLTTTKEKNTKVNKVLKNELLIKMHKDV